MDACIHFGFGVNIGQELNHSHPAVVLYSKPNVGTVLVAPLTSKENESDVVIDIGEIKDFEGFSYCKIDQIRAVSKLRIQTKKHEDKLDNERIQNTIQTDISKVSD